MAFLSSNTAPVEHVEESASPPMSFTLNCSSPVTMTVNTAAHFTVSVSPRLPQPAGQAHDQPSQDSTTARPMTPASVTESAEEVITSATTAMPDYMLDPNAVCKDIASWRHGKAPDYSTTRRVYADSKSRRDRHQAVHLLSPSQDSGPCDRESSKPCRKPGQELGDRGIIQDQCQRFSDGALQPLQVLRERKGDTSPQDNDGSRYLQCTHRPQ